MKFTEEMQDRIISFVEKNGLQPQPCGATLKSLCDFCGIDWKTFRRWEQNAEFAERLSCAREKFAATLLQDLESSLIRSAKGAEVKKIREEAKAEISEIKKEDGTKETKIGALKTTKALRETYQQAPDVRALQFALSNLAPDRWKLKQETTVQAGQGVQISMNLSQPALEGLTTALEDGAQPRAPKEEVSL